MATESRVTTGRLPAVISGTVDLTVSGFGDVGAAIFFISVAGTNNPQTTLSQWGIGFWDRTNQFGAGVASSDAKTVSQCSRGHHSTNAIVLPVTGATAWNIRASASAITNGVRLTVTEDNTGAEREVTAVFFKGLTNAFCGAHTFDNTTNANNITAPGFKPDLVFLAGVSLGSGTAYSTGSILTFGAAHNNSSDTITQVSLGISDVDNVSTTNTESRVDDDKIGNQISNGSLLRTISASDFDSSGLSLTQSVASTNQVIYLALELADPDDAYVGIIDTETDTGTQAYTGFGIPPDAAIMLGNICTAVDTITQGLSVGQCAADSTTERSIMSWSEDAEGTSDTESEYSNNALHIMLDDGTADGIAALSSLDSDGLTLNYTTASASARKVPIFAIGNSNSIYPNGVLSNWNGLSSYKWNGVT